MNVKIINPEKNLSNLNFRFPSSCYKKEDDYLDEGEEKRLGLEVFLINNELNGGKTIKTYLREFELEDGRILECIGTIYKSENGKAGMTFILKKVYFEDKKTQDFVQTLCADQLKNLFFEWHPKYFNSEWRKKFPDMRQESCYGGSVNG